MEMETPETPNCSIEKPNYQMYAELEGHTKAVSVVKFSPSGRLLASGSVDKYFRIWTTDTEILQEVSCVKAHTSGLNDISWTYDGRFLATCSDDCTAKLFDVETSRRKLLLKGHSNFIISVSFNPHSNLVLTGSFDNTARVWDVRDGKCIKLLEGHTEPLCAATFNHDGTQICTSSYDGVINLWDMSNGTCCKTLQGIEGDDTGKSVPCSFAKYSPNGRYLLVAKHNSKLYLVDANKEKVVRIYSGHLNESYCLFSDFAVTGGKYIVSGSEDGKMYVWNLQSSELLQTVDAANAENDVVICSTCHPSTNVIASCSIGPNDRTVRLWKSDH